MARPGSLIHMDKLFRHGLFRNVNRNQNALTKNNYCCQPTKSWEQNSATISRVGNKALTLSKLCRPRTVSRYAECVNQQRTVNSIKLLQPKLAQNYEWSRCSPLATSSRAPAVHVSSLVRLFHTTPRAYVPPVIWLFIKPVAKITAMLSGRFARKWWQALPNKKRILCKENIKKNWYWITLGGVALSGLAYGYYRSHLQETPITNRVRFLAVTDDQFMKIAEAEAEMLLATYKEDILPVDHAYTKKVVELTRRLVSSNRDMPKMKNMKWTVAVIDRPDRNAFVLPTGHIFVFTGLLDIALTDDQVAIVLGHELAHAILSHAAEQLSFMQLVDWMIIVVMAGIWTIMPADGIAVITQWFYHKVVDFVIHMPYSRKLEKEADKVGLHLCAKACFDVRDSSAFWSIMDCLAKVRDATIPEWLSTHPSEENRVKHLDFLIPKAIEQRAACSCPALPSADPRDRLKPIQQCTTNIVRASQAGINMKQVHVIASRKQRLPGPQTA